MKHYFLFILILGYTLQSCKKGFLEAVPDKTLSTPSTLNDFQSLLDNTDMYTRNPSLGDVSTDEYYVTALSLQTQLYQLQNAYKWNADTYSGGSGNVIPDWNRNFLSIYITNIVLDELPKVAETTANESAWNSIKGSALFYRGFYYYNLSQAFTLPYNATTSKTLPGLPLRLTSNLNDVTPRSSIEQTYTQIINDLNQSIAFLPESIPTSTYINRPSKAAAYAMLAKTYLVMQDYNKSLSNAIHCLNIYDSIVNYNNVSSVSRFPFTKSFAEIIMYSSQLAYLILQNGGAVANVDSTLFRSYDNNDLRKTLYFTTNASTGLPNYRGAYTGDGNRFGGIATDEILLIKAECEARLGNSGTAMTDLNQLLQNRWKTGTYTTLTATSADDALTKILNERQKELVLRNTRWADLRRLNQDTRFQKTLTRTIGADKYSLPPNDKRYALLIPADEIQLTGISQNQR